MDTHTPAPRRDAELRRTPPAADRDPGTTGVPAAPATAALAVLLVAAGALTLGEQPVLDPEALAVGRDRVTSWRLLTWWLAHDGVVHLGGNLALLVLFAPAFERYVGTRRVVVTVLAGNVLGLLAHLAVHPTRPLLGASAGLYAIAAYSLVVGWHCPFESRRGQLRVWPSQVLTALFSWEVVRWGVDIAASRPPSGAAAHLGGLAAGVAVCGVVHRRLPWLAAPGATVPGGPPPGDGR